MYDKGSVDGADRVEDASVTVEEVHAAQVMAAHTGNLAMLARNAVLLNTFPVRDLALKGDSPSVAFRRRMELH